MTLYCYCDAGELLDAATSIVDEALRTVVATRVAHMRAVGTLDMTVLAIILRDTTEEELIETLGWTPTVDPDGRRVGEEGFRQAFDYAYRVHPDWFVAIRTVGDGGFAYELLVHVDADPTLVRLCESHDRP